jgi:hypothetical protein
MQQSKSKFWFVPRKNLIVPRGDDSYSGITLRRADSGFDPTTDQMVASGDTFTILLKSFYVVQDKDRGDNDIFVQSWTRYGTMPQIEVSHFFKKDIPVPYFCHNELIAEHLFSFENHVEENRIWTRVQIIEIDGRKVDQIAQFVDTELHGTIRTFGAVFPGTLPFVSTATDMANIAIDLFGKLKKIVSNQNDTIFDVALDLCAINSGETPFRYGVYVFFQRAIDGTQYKLNQFRVESIDALSSDEKDASTPDSSIPDYIAIEVLPGIVNAFNQDEILLHQNLATGLLPFDDKLMDRGERDERFHYLQRLMKKAQMVADLREYYTLVNEQQLGNVLSPHQQKRYQALALEFSEYIELFDEILRIKD